MHEVRLLKPRAVLSVCRLHLHMHHHIHTDTAKALRQHYFAAVTFSDENIGIALDALKTTGYDQSTVVVLFGDHGWQCVARAHSFPCCSIRAPLLHTVGDVLVANGEHFNL